MLRAVVEKEEGREDRQEDAGQGLHDDLDAFQARRGDLVGVGADGLAEVLGDLVDLLLGDVERALEQPVAQVVDAVLDLVGEVVDVRHDLPGHEPADQPHHDEAEDRGERRGDAAREAVADQAGHRRLEQGRDEECGYEGQDHELDGADDAHQDPDRAGQDQQPPARLGGDAHAPGHGERGVGAVAGDGDRYGFPGLGVFGVVGGRFGRGLGVFLRHLGPALVQPLPHLAQSGADLAEPSWYSRHDCPLPPSCPTTPPWSRCVSDRTGRRPLPL
jgi:hypothetical protein